MFSLQNVQIGLDLATSLTIVGAAFSWYQTNKRSQRAERERGINEASRSVAAANTHQILIELSKQFKDLVAQAQRIEKPIDLRFRRGDLEAVVKALNDGDIKGADVLEDLTKFREQISEFYESTAAARYPLFPALYALPEAESKEAVEAFKTSYKQIGEVHNRLSGGYIAFFEEYQILVRAAKAYQEEAGEQNSPGGFYERHTDKVNSILLDKDYADVVDALVPAGQEPLYRGIYEKLGTRVELTQAEKELLLEVALKLSVTMLKQPNRLQAVFLHNVSRSIQESRMECKKFLVELAAILARLLSKDSGAPIQDIAEKLQGEGYFAVETEIR